MRCVICHLVFCCRDCRWKHEKVNHGLTYDCPICRGHRFLCRPEDLNQDFIQHLTTEHLPLQCRKCNKLFSKMEDLDEIDKCSTISELFDSNIEDKKENVEEKFDLLYDKNNNDGDNNFEAIVSINNSTKTAVITPIIRKKNLVDYESSDEWDDSLKQNRTAKVTPYPKMNPTSPVKKICRTATPHAKKALKLMRQQAVEGDTEVDEENCNHSYINGETPLRCNNIEIPESEQEMTTPTSQPQHVLKLTQVVTTSTPTHPGVWSMFSGPGTDSPLSEIEPTGSPAESTDKETEPLRLDKIVPPKIKGIIVGSRLKLGSQDSSEKQVTYQDSDNTTETSVKSKRVKFAEDTIFKQEPKIKRVFKKPKRMLTPGRQRPKISNNPCFQALINRFECQGLAARTPVNMRDCEKALDNTPATSEHNIPARAISFKDDSPVTEADSQSKESNELFRTCLESPVQPINNAITSLTTNIAGTLQTCLTSVLRSTDEETEIQFKFVISKKKVSVKRIVSDGVLEELTEMEHKEETKKDNILVTVVNAVKNVFWGNAVTPYKSPGSNDTTSSSASKRKFDELSESDFSPLNHKRYKYEGRIKGRPPLHSGRSTCGVSTLRSSHSAEQHLLLKEMAMNREDNFNCSF